MIEGFTARLISQWQTQSPKYSSAIRVFLKRFSRSLPPVKSFQEVHEEVFEKFDCLQCASCCKNSSPVFNRTDISRIADFLGIRPTQLESEYLRADADGDFIPVSKPCTFLEKTNHCRIYEVRPRSCRGFPHTDNPEFWQRHARMTANALACPAAFAIVENFRSRATG